MIRFALLLLAALLAVAPSHAETADGWVKIATVEIDLKAAGKKLIALGGAGRYRALRFETTPMRNLIWLAQDQESQGTLKVTSMPVKLSAAGADISKKLDSLEVVWAAEPSAPVPVTLVILGQLIVNDRAVSEKKESQPPKPLESVKPAPPKSAPAPTAASPPPPPVAATPSAPAPPTRGITNSAPPAQPGSTIGGKAPAPASPSAVGDAVAAKPNVCVDTAVCTIVDVFYGTDRKATPGPDRLGFGGDRADKLTLGHAFVTVPKSKRSKGSIPLPGLWDKYVRGVPPEGDPAQHFTIPKNGVTVYSTEAEFLLAAKKHIATAGDFKNHAFIFVHGFYVTFDNALYRTAQIAYDLSPDGKPFGTAFLYSWPSAGNASAYIYDQDSAQFSVPHLQAFMRTVIDKTGVENVHIIAHSMGNVALIGALQEMARTETKARVNQIILAAPDLDKQQFERVAGSVERVAKGMTLYASQGDSALALARKVRGGTPRAGESLTPPGPAVVAGIDTIDVSAIPTSVFSWGHDSYADSSELLADIYSVFTKGDHPPTKRSDRFKLLQQGALQYWRYAK